MEGQAAPSSVHQKSGSLCCVTGSGRASPHKRPVPAMFIALAVGALVLAAFVVARRQRSASPEDVSPCHSVNFHFTRQCNYKCGFCFHTAKTSDHLPLDDIERGLGLLVAAGTRKVNFSGGEPFLFPKLLGDMCRHCKELGMNVSIISNGSKITEKWMEKYAEFVDILAVSCDSFDEETNEKIGRREKTASQGDIARRVSDWCTQYGVVFKLNTVVNQLNWQEDMIEAVRELQPSRWKVFQCLEIEGENAGEDALRQAREFVITEDQFQAFVHRHAELHPVVEDNDTMRDSYLLLDEQMRFLNSRSGRKVPTKSILEIGVDAALQDSGFDQAKFFGRSGVYDYDKRAYFDTKPCNASSSGGGDDNLVDIEDLVSSRA
eukprot:m.6873 g.6873  ORF g.6873 m.6873 type:complete len:377 (-) comp2671_c0_seq1:37-1167(-)